MENLCRVKLHFESTIDLLGFLIDIMLQWKGIRLTGTTGCPYSTSVVRGSGDGEGWARGEPSPPFCWH